MPTLEEAAPGPAARPAPVPFAGREPGHQAYMVLRPAFTLAPIAFGLDRFFNVLTDWPQYLAGWVNDLMPGSGQDFRYFVGGVEILAGVLVALRDFGLLLGALTLTRLAFA